jgi:hypothetical protein
LAAKGRQGLRGLQGLTARRRTAIAVVSVVLAACVISFSILVWPFGAQHPSLALSPTSARTRAPVMASGSQFTPGSRVALRVGAKTTDARDIQVGEDGRFSATFTVPDIEPGTHTVGVVPTSGSSALVATATLTVLPGAETARATPTAGTPTPHPSPSPSPTVKAGEATATPKPAATPRPPAPTPRPTTTAPISKVKILFGLGSQIELANAYRLTREAPIHMLSAWYNGPNDLGWITDSYHQSIYRRQYAAGRSLHLIVWSDVPNATITTKYGTACGRPYPLSDRFLTDIGRVAKAFAGSGRFYVTLFTEFQTYACDADAWNPNPQTNAYWRALKDRYLAARTIIKRNAPKALVSLGWGGWQMMWDEPAIGGGRSMIPYFADVMRASDFQSFQSMRMDSNVSNIVAMTKVLGAYGPVMLAHYRPENQSQAVYDADLRTLFTDRYMRMLRSAGLFAWSFMDTHNLEASSTTYAFVKAAIRKYGL